VGVFFRGWARTKRGTIVRLAAVKFLAVTGHERYGVEIVSSHRPAVRRGSHALYALPRAIDRSRVKCRSCLGCAMRAARRMRDTACWRQCCRRYSGDGNGWVRRPLAQELPRCELTKEKLRFSYHIRAKNSHVSRRHFRSLSDSPREPITGDSRVKRLRCAAAVIRRTTCNDRLSWRMFSVESVPPDRGHLHTSGNGRTRTTRKQRRIVLSVCRRCEFTGTWLFPRAPVNAAKHT